MACQHENCADVSSDLAVVVEKDMADHMDD
jgi:hypothetical protein